MRVAISSGHGDQVRGASCYIDEVDEAQVVVEEVADRLRKQGVDVATFHDEDSTTQDENLATIVSWHNSQSRDIDISVHFNAYEPTPDPMGTEVWYVSNKTKAQDVVNQLAKVGFINRGAKYSDSLYFLNNTDEPAILIETCFVDSKADTELYKEKFESVCDHIALGIVGGGEVS